jgi:predicted short-subunit dehydrogenase-like oxidoreductase (DUF2520 family)
MTKERIVLIGPGRVGQAVARLLWEAGHELAAIISRDPGRALAAARFVGAPGAATTDLSRAREGSIVLLALPDDHIAEMAARLRRQSHLAPGTLLVHFSGLHPAAILLGEEGPPVRGLSLHPLQPMADAVMGVRILPGSPFAVEGTDELLPLGERLVGEMGGIPFRISSAQKPLYHAAACMASNYMVALTAAAEQILTACGLDEPASSRLLAPLVRTTAQNLAALGPEVALTGPISRGDVRTVAKHLKALAEAPGELTTIYKVLGRKTVEVARSKGTLGEKEAAKILELLQ